MSALDDITDAARLDALHDIRLPPLSGAERVGELMLAAGLGLGVVVFALGLLHGWRWMMAPRPTTLRAQLALLDTLPPEERLGRLAGMAAQRGVALPDALRAQLYAPGGDADALADAIKVALRGGGR